MTQKNHENSNPTGGRTREASHRGERGNASGFEHLPPELNKARVENVKKIEQDLDADEPIQQMREGRRRRRP